MYCFVLYDIVIFALYIFTGLNPIFSTNTRKYDIALWNHPAKDMYKMYHLNLKVKIHFLMILISGLSDAQVVHLMSE
jgi:hypothetical protein